MTEPVNKKSGCGYRRERDRKNKLREDVLHKTSKIDVFFKKASTDVNEPVDKHQQCNELLQSNLKSDTNQHEQCIDLILPDYENNALRTDLLTNTPDIELQCDENTASEASSNSNYVSNTQFGVDFREICDDPLKWNKNDDVFITNLLQNQITQDIRKLDYSKSKRRFAGDHDRLCSFKLFLKKQANGEIVRREWLFYSESLGRMFCIYCQLFSEKRCGLFTDKGFDDWKHVNLISHHETSTSHYAAARIFAQRTSQVSNICSQLTKQISAETSYWKDVLKRIVTVLRFITSGGLPIYGANSHIGSPNNGNYLGLLELLSKYDVLLETHIKKYANKGRGHVSYLSVTIANEFIHVLANEVRAVFIRDIEISKYYSLIVDSTPDVSHKDQLTTVIRLTDQTGSAIERFLEFLENTGHKGKEMEAVVIDFLKIKTINIMDCRGQSYDTAANMSGKFNGLQARIKQINPLAVYVPCGSHRLNLTVFHAAQSNSIIVRFFLFIQNVYVFFSRSPTHRWPILVKHFEKDLRTRNIKGERVLVPKRLSDTRWAARADACRAIKAGYGSFINALTEISENTEEDQIVRIEAKSIRDEFFKLETAMLVEFWSTILHRVKTTSMSLQDPTIDIEKSILLQQSLIHYFEKTRNEESFSNFERRGQNLINDHRSGLKNNPNLTYNCYEKRIAKRSTRYDIGRGPETILDDRASFRVNCFYTALDSILTHLRSSTSAFETIMKPIVFLISLDSPTRTNEELRNQAANLRSIYCNDLDESLYDECQQFKYFMKDINDEIQKYLEQLELTKNSNDEDDDDDDEADYRKKAKLMSKSSRMLKYIKKANIEATFPNISTALRIFEVIAVCNASGERSFSKLKRVKGPLRSTETQQTLNDLSMLYMNSDILEKIDTDQIINSFALAKARRKTFNVGPQ